MTTHTHGPGVRVVSHLIEIDSTPHYTIREPHRRHLRDTRSPPPPSTTPDSWANVIDYLHRYPIDLSTQEPIYEEA